VVVINADKIRLTATKVEQKFYLFAQRVSGRTEGSSGEALREAKPEWMVREAIVGMLPKNKLRARRAKKLRVYRDARV